MGKQTRSIAQEARKRIDELEVGGVQRRVDPQISRKFESLLTTPETINLAATIAEMAQVIDGNQIVAGLLAALNRVA